MSRKPTPGAKQGKDKIKSVEETVWSLRLGDKNPPCNVAKFEEIWVGNGASKCKVTRPPFDDPRVFTRPAYMYREQEVEEHSEDESFEGPGKVDAFDRPAFKRRVAKTRSIQWVLEDKKDFAKGGGIKYVGDKTTMSSKYAIFRVSDLAANTIEVIPVSEWWNFKRPPRDDAKMTVKEAEDLMKMQENFLGPLSLANKVMSKAAADAGAQGGAAAGYGDLDREDTQVLREAGVGPDEMDKPAPGGDQESDVEERPDPLEKGEVDSDAGGEDDDFGDEVRSDDEEEVGNDDANEGGGTLHQDDEDLRDSEEDEYADQEEEEQKGLEKLSKDVNATGEEEDKYNGPATTGEPSRSSATTSSNGNSTAPAVAPTSAEKPVSGASEDKPKVAAEAITSNGKRPANAMDRSDGVGGGAAGAGVGAGVASGGDAKRARKEKKKINQENVVDTLKRHGGRLSSKDVLGKFMSALKKTTDRSGVNKLREILNKVATKVDDAIDGQVWVLKQHYS